MKKSISFLSFILLVLFTVRSYSQSIETVIQAGHYSEVTAVCYSPDGKLVATGSDDKTVKLWRRSDGREIRTYQGNSDGISELHINRQGTAILSVANDGYVTIWELSTGKLILRMKPDKDLFTCASFSPDGLKIITGSRKSYISVWETETGKKISDIRAVPFDLYGDKGFDYPYSETVTYSIDGRFIVAGVSDYTAIIWDAATGKEIRKFKKANSTCTSCKSEALITPDSRYIILASGDSLKVFDRESGKVIKELFGQGGSPESLTISGDNRYVGAVGYGVAEVWDLKTWKQVLKTGDYSERKIMAIALSPDGKELAAGNEKRTADVIMTETGKVLLTLRGYLNQVDEKILTDPYMYWASMVNEAKLSPDGKYIAVGRTGNNAKLLDFKTGKIYRTLRGHKRMVISLCFSADGKYLATGGLDGQAFVWNVETGDSVMVVKFPDEKNAIYSVDISADNKYLATADWGGLVVIWDIGSGQRIRAVSPHDRMGCYQVKLLPNNVYFISAGLDRKLKLIEIDTGEEIRNFVGHTDLVNSISLTPQGDKFITASRDGSIRVWDMTSGLQARKIAGHKGGAYSAKLDQSGKYIVSGGDDFLIKLWDLQTGNLVSEFAGHNGGVGDVNISGDNKYIISGSRDGSLKVWSVAGRKELVSVVFLNENDWFIKNPDGYFDASEGAYNSISFVKGTEIFNIGQFFNEFYRPGLYGEIYRGGDTGYRQNLLQTIDKFPPPLVEIIMPEADAKTENPMAAFMVKVTNNGGGVKEFKVMHNGKRQDIDFSDLSRMSKKGQYAMKTFDLNLVPGNNEISVSAYSNGEIESSEANINVIYSGIQKTSDCYLVCVGINKYENESMNLTYARSDAQAFANIIKVRGEKLFSRIYTYTIYDRDATKGKILSTIDEISKVIKKEDVFVYFYAGHGSMIDNNFYFVTSDVTGMYQQDKLKSALYVKELQDKFRLLPALKQVVFIDACQSGSSVEALAMRGGAEEKALAQLSRSSGIHVMASSESQQQSAEINTLNHGVFTYVLLEALNGKADGAPADSKITVYEIKSYIDDQVPDLSYRLIRHKQFPSTFSIGHDFPLGME